MGDIRLLGNDNWMTSMKSARGKKNDTTRSVSSRHPPPFFENLIKVSLVRDLWYYKGIVLTFSQTLSFLVTHFNAQNILHRPLADSVV